jgi:type I restriction enzyme S subunit
MIPDHWTIVPLETLATYKAGRTPARDNTRFWEGGSDRLPWVSIADMENYGLVTQTKETITRDAFDQVFRSQIVRAGTLLMSFKLTIGRVATLGIDACHNEAIISIYPKRAVDQRFLSYFLSQVDYENHQDRQIKGNTLNQDKINRIPVTLPLPHEQSAIADVLDCVRAGIDIQVRTDSTARELKCAAMRELFTRGLRGEAQKETEIGLVPESWVLTPAEHIFKLTSGKTRPDHLSQDPTNEKPFPVLGGNGVMGYSSEWYLESDKILVIGRVGEYCGAIHFASGKVWITDNALYVKEWLNPSANIGYFGAFLHYFDLNRFKRMAGQPLVTQGMINEHSFPLPSLDEQRNIVEILDAIDRKIDLHKRKRVILEEFFKTLLHKLMTGEIRAADLNLSALKPAERPQAAE